MMQNQTDIRGFNIGEPLLYTGNQSKRVFCEANALIDHINIFDCTLPQIDYTLFSELKGDIKYVIDSRQEVNHALSEVSVGSTKTKYHFSDSQELLSIDVTSGKSREVTMIFDSLKKRNKVIITQYSGSKVYSVKEIFFTKTMRYQKLKEDFVYKNESKTTLIDPVIKEKYVYTDNVITRKIRIVNNAQEQSKTTICFDVNSNILQVIAKDQRHKKVLYQSTYLYNDLNNIETVTFEKFSGDIPFTEDYMFQYDANGNLTSSGGKTYLYDENQNIIKSTDYNHSKTKTHEVINAYTYDSSKNWVKKETKNYYYKNGQKILSSESDTDRVIKYY